MTRRRSNAIDFNSPARTKEEQAEKNCILSFSGIYLNFEANSYVKHADLDKKKIREYVAGFSSKVADGRASDPFADYLGKYLEPCDFVALKKTCRFNQS